MRLRNLRHSLLKIPAGIFLFTASILFGEHTDLIKGALGGPGDIPAAKAVLPEASKLRVMKSAYFLIYYDALINLKAVERRMKRGALFPFLLEDNSPMIQDERVAMRLDALFEKTKNILGMRPRIKDIKIKIFSDKDALAEEYFNIFKRREEHKSFYVHLYKTIYVYEKEISDTVMSHEMAHAVIDHYFDSPPPPKIGELLASYVTAHIED